MRAQRRDRGEESVSADEIIDIDNDDPERRKAFAAEQFILTGQALAQNQRHQLDLQRQVLIGSRLRDALAAAKVLHELDPQDVRAKDDYISLLKQVVLAGREPPPPARETSVIITPPSHNRTTSPSVPRLKPRVLGLAMPALPSPPSSPTVSIVQALGLSMPPPPPPPPPIISRLAQ